MFIGGLGVHVGVGDEDSLGELATEGGVRFLRDGGPSPGGVGAGPFLEETLQGGAAEIVFVDVLGGGEGG